MSDELDKLPKFDPLDTAERMLGKGDDSVALGFMLHMDHNRRKNAALLDRDDTTLNNTVERYRSILQSLGFELVLELPFVGSGYDHTDPSREETYFMYAHRDGLLLCFDTYCTDMVNGAKVYYNWTPNPGVDHWTVTSSGSWHDYQDCNNPGVWCGDHDAREALRHKLNGLRNAGVFLAQWKKNPFLWLLHYADVRQSGYDYAAINKERILMLPQWVQNMIGAV